MRAKEPVNCQEKKVTVIISTFCRVKTTATPPSNNPKIKNMII
jgi:hypothetical protein